MTCPRSHSQDMNPGSLAQNLEHTTLSCAHRQIHADASAGQRLLEVESSPCPSHGLVGLALPFPAHALKEVSFSADSGLTVACIYISTGASFQLPPFTEHNESWSTRASVSFHTYSL